MFQHLHVPVRADGAGEIDEGAPEQEFRLSGYQRSILDLQC